MRIIFQLFKCPSRLHGTIMNDDNAICQMQKVNRMSDQNSCLFFQTSLEYFIEDPFADVGVEC